MDEAKAAASAAAAVDAPAVSAELVPLEDRAPSSEAESPVALDPGIGLESEESSGGETATTLEVETSPVEPLAEDVTLPDSAAPLAEAEPVETLAKIRDAELPSDDATPDEPALIVTETMAEVLLQQGHTDDALRIYRELERRNGGDARIQAKRIELEARTAVPATPAQRYDARDTGGQSVTAFFGELLAARLTAKTPAPGAAAKPPMPSSSAVMGAGAPTRPASDSLSLSAVFGDDASPVPPAVPAAKPNVSFDEFFGASGDGRSGKGASVPAPKEDDLDQFHAWLQNLKR
jgi:hypothetical protein